MGSFMSTGIQAGGHHLSSLPNDDMLKDFFQNKNTGELGGFEIQIKKDLSGDDQSNDSSRTFVFYDEGHTLGNALRCVITGYPEVAFCGYTVPHPAETKMHFRIQTNGIRAVDILQRGLADLEKMCDHTLKVFDESLEEYKKTNPAKTDSDVESTETESD